MTVAQLETSELYTLKEKWYVNYLNKAVIKNKNKKGRWPSKSESRIIHSYVLFSPFLSSCPRPHSPSPQSDHESRWGHSGISSSR